jgi:ubiquinone/menaquinone biosynthesis C-methylase UbiE
MTHRRLYLPAAGWDCLLPFYDAGSRLFGGDAVRSSLLEQMTLEPGQRALDIGCATGTLLLLLKQCCPATTVVGLDPDANALARAQKKAHRSGLELQLCRAFSDRLPFADGSFQHVTCTLMFSLLAFEEKVATLREVARVLGPGGSFHLLDLVKTPPGSRLWKRVLGASGGYHVCTEEETIALMAQAGLNGAMKTGRHPFWLWPLVSYQASR